RTPVPTLVPRQILHVATLTTSRQYATGPYSGHSTWWLWLAANRPHLITHESALGSRHPHDHSWDQKPLVTHPTTTTLPTAAAGPGWHRYTQPPIPQEFLTPQDWLVTVPENPKDEPNHPPNQPAVQLELVQNPLSLILGKQHRTLPGPRYRVHPLFDHPVEHRLYQVLELLGHLILHRYRQLTEFLVLDHHQPIRGHLHLLGHHDRFQIPPKLRAGRLEHWPIHHHVHQRYRLGLPILLVVLLAQRPRIGRLRQRLLPHCRIAVPLVHPQTRRRTVILLPGLVEV